MKSLNLLIVLSIFLVGALFTSCNDDDDETTPITLGSSVTVTNTLQTAAAPSDGGTGGVETPIETIFGQSANALAATETISTAKEFPAYLNGLYDIDLDEDEITFTLVATANDPTYSMFFRTLEAGTFDRYYFKFDEDQNINSGSSSSSSVRLNVVSNNEVYVEIGEGFNFNPNETFTITLD